MLCDCIYQIRCTVDILVAGSPGSSLAPRGPKRGLSQSSQRKLYLFINHYYLCVDFPGKSQNEKNDHCFLIILTSDAQTNSPKMD